MPVALQWSAMILTFLSNRSRSTTMHGVGRTSFVISRKSRRAMRDSNSAWGNSLVFVLAARAFAALRKLAVVPAVIRKVRRDVMRSHLRSAATDYTPVAVKQENLERAFWTFG